MNNNPLNFLLPDAEPPRQTRMTWGTVVATTPFVQILPDNSYSIGRGAQVGEIDLADPPPFSPFTVEIQPFDGDALPAGWQPVPVTECIPSPDGLTMAGSSAYCGVEHQGVLIGGAQYSWTLEVKVPHGSPATSPHVDFFAPGHTEPVGGGQVPPDDAWVPLSGEFTAPYDGGVRLALGGPEEAVLRQCQVRDFVLNMVEPAPGMGGATTSRRAGIPNLHLATLLDYEIVPRPLTYEPDSLINLGELQVGDRVRLEESDTYYVVVGKGEPTVFPPPDPPEPPTMEEALADQARPDQWLMRFWNGVKTGNRTNWHGFSYGNLAYLPAPSGHRHMTLAETNPPAGTLAPDLNIPAGTFVNGYGLMRTIVFCATARQWTLRLMADDAGKLFINGDGPHANVFGNNASANPATAHPTSDLFFGTDRTVTLPAGWSIIDIIVEQGSGAVRAGFSAGVGQSLRTVVDGMWAPVVGAPTVPWGWATADPVDRRMYAICEVPPPWNGPVTLAGMPPRTDSTVAPWFIWRRGWEVALDGGQALPSEGVTIPDWSITGDAVWPDFVPPGYRPDGFMVTVPSSTQVAGRQPDITMRLAPNGEAQLVVSGGAITFATNRFFATSGARFLSSRTLHTRPGS